MRLLTAVSSLLIAFACSGARAADPVFVDATQGSGIEYTNVCGAPFQDKGWIVEYMGAGAAWLDYDGDGHLDLYLVNGSTFERGPGEGEPNQLYRGDGKGHFEDVTVESKTGDRGWGYGVAVGDVDNDGDPDLYVTNLGANTLYRNNGDGTFSDVTPGAGVGDEGWGTSAAFFDMEGDGDLDLYVANYVAFDKQTIPRRGTKRSEPPFCDFKGIAVFCGPRGLTPAQNVLYRNNGDGTFSDASSDSGILLNRPRYSLGVVTGDFNNDGHPDIYVANDSVVNSLWRGNGDGTFKDVGLMTFSALDSDGNPQGGMGTAFGDYNGDGWLDLVVTNFSHDMNTVYRNMNGKFFVDDSTAVGMPATVLELSWGAGFYDFDNDADEDLFIANGHVYPEVDKEDIGTTFKQANHLFVYDDRKFRKADSPGISIAGVWRGTAFGDYDADGDVDILVTALDAPALLLRNETPAGHYLEIELEGTLSNRDAVGARVVLSAGGRELMRERHGGGSYLSASAPSLHFGLGAATRVERLVVRWPGGDEQVLENVPADQLLRIREPKH